MYEIQLTPVPDNFASVRSNPSKNPLNDTITTIPTDNSLACPHAQKLLSTTSSSKDALLPSDPSQTQPQIPTTTRKRPFVLLLSLFLIQILLLCGAEYLVSVTTLLWVSPRQDRPHADTWLEVQGEQGPQMIWMGPQPERSTAEQERFQRVKVCVWTLLTVFHVLSVCLIGAQIQEILCVASVAMEGQSKKSSKLQRLLLLPCYAAVSLVWVHLCVGWLVLRHRFFDSEVMMGRWGWIDEVVNGVVVWGLLITFFLSLVWSLVECAKLRSIRREGEWEQEEEEDAIEEEKEYQITIL